MSEKRFTIKPQDDYWAVVDNHNEDKVCIINGIHTEIEAIWLCDFMNEQQGTITELKKDLKTVIDSYDCERIGYCHKGEYCKKWSLNNDR